MNVCLIFVIFKSCITVQHNPQGYSLHTYVLCIPLHCQGHFSPDSDLCRLYFLEGSKQHSQMGPSWARPVPNWGPTWPNRGPNGAHMECCFGIQIRADLKSNFHLFLGISVTPPPPSRSLALHPPCICDRPLIVRL